ncbi:MAG: radical SAM protein [Promethearchaeati archaeon SRVP18_Atabeyarchaeia-1]
MNQEDQQEKKYYRIRPARWYGGIVTADCSGCGLLCKFCWVADEVMSNPASVGRFYTPRRIADEILVIAKKRKLDQIRVSGGEPTIGKPHLLQLLRRIEGYGKKFILETNGIPIAADKEYAENLSDYRSFLHVRVSLKGCDEEEFSILTGARPEQFQLQLKALEYLVEARVECHPSVMTSFSTTESYNALNRRLKNMDPLLAQNTEIEELILYPHVVKRLKKYGLAYSIGHRPDQVPLDQI